MGYTSFFPLPSYLLLLIFMGLEYGAEEGEKGPKAVDGTVIIYSLSLQNLKVFPSWVLPWILQLSL